MSRFRQKATATHFDTRAGTPPLAHLAVHRGCEPLDGDEKLELTEAARPLWDALEALGRTDAHGGIEFERVFPTTVDYIHRQASDDD